MSVLWGLGVEFWKCPYWNKHLDHSEVGIETSDFILETEWIRMAIDVLEQWNDTVTAT